jgi:hypothetical protein
LNFMQSQKKIIKHAIDRKLIWQAIILGIAGYYSLPALRFLSHLLIHSVGKNEPREMLFTYPLMSALFFYGSTTIVYFVCVSLKSKTSFSDYLIANGFGGLYLLLTNILFVPIILLSKVITQHVQSSPIAIGATIVFVIIVIFSIIFTVKYQIIAITDVFRFRIVQSTLIWIILYVPIFAVYIKLLKD